MSQSARSSFFGSLLFKLMVVVVALGGTTAAAVGIGLIAFGGLFGSLQTMTQDVLPDITDSFAVIEKTNNVSEALRELSAAEDIPAVDAKLARFEATSAELSEATNALQPEAIARIQPMIDAVDASAGDVANALRRRFTAEQEMLRQLDGFLTLGEQARGYLVELMDTAFFDLTIGGEDTVTSVNETLSKLTDEAFATMQAALNLRAEVGLSTGVTLALAQTRDPSLSSILEDLQSASLNRLARQMETLDKEESAAPFMQPVHETYDLLQELAGRGSLRVARDVDQILRLRQSSDAALSELTDNLSFDLVILAEETAAENETAIQELLHSQVGNILQAAEIDTASKQVFISALLGIIARDVAAVDATQTLLSEQAAALMELVDASDVDDRLREVLAASLALTSADTGLLAARKTYLEDVVIERQHAESARGRLSAISKEAQSEGARAVSMVTDAGMGILESTKASQSQMHFVALTAAAVIAIALIASWMLILRPMVRLTDVTLRLSQGDLSEVTGFDRIGGEISRMGEALSVFRSGLIERQEMAVRDKERAEQEHKAQLEAQDAKRKADEAAAREKQRLRDEELQRKAEEEERKRKLEAAAQAERDKHAAELDIVVNNLEAALMRLSQGDLSVAIEADFPPAYKELRVNFNMALDNLSGLIQSLKDSASNVSASSADIAASARDIAERTEHAAAALENSTTSISELDASAHQMSERSGKANEVMIETREKAMSSKAIVETAVATMGEIESSSDQISKIVSLIDDIAFQTNLLALNAGVEAARAGEQGRGFAVVATEVRALAQRSSDAASEINELITRSRAQISKGAVEVGEAGVSLVTILDSITSVSGTISEIAHGTHEQSETISGINKSIARVQDTTQRTAALFEESFATSELLKTEAANLERISQGFKTSEIDRDGDEPRFAAE
ncbi:hypothetical protein E4Z66_01570 [Aliishimia ponticola]|uniref:HAMP domain-containing protein n=1 Tax=Aliishimia ponticola TaxID=2499833 RepID=A0A4S4NHW9_9RHOB|nr:methyl-accepting chemotaxis protein [Aliishimia ponticola]THH38287.1 hypothetical protein E4Z66_01570 [Aliishimia ponticola]